MITQVALSVGAFIRAYGIPETDEETQAAIAAWGVGKTEQEKKLAKIVMDSYEQLWREFESGRFPIKEFNKRAEEKVMELKRLYDISPVEMN